jgi:hypothetical protein
MFVYVKILNGTPHDIQISTYVRRPDFSFSVRLFVMTMCQSTESSRSCAAVTNT